MIKYNIDDLWLKATFREKFNESKNQLKLAEW